MLVLEMMEISIGTHYILLKEDHEYVNKVCTTNKIHKMILSSPNHKNEESIANVMNHNKRGIMLCESNLW